MKFTAMIGAIALLAVSLVVPVDLAAQQQTVNTYQAGVSLFTLQSAKSTATSSAVRLPNFSTSGILTITYAGITGSPSGCTFALAGESNNSQTPTSAIATVNLSPSNGVVTIPVSPSVPASDKLIGTYACSAYPTAGTITASFSPLASGSSADPCQSSSVSKSSVSLSITTATTTQLVALTAGKKIYVCNVGASLGASTTVALEYGTGSTCGTGTTALSGAIAGTLDLGYGGTVASTPAGNALCALSTGTGGIQGTLTYVQQ